MGRPKKFTIVAPKKAKAVKVTKQPKKTMKKASENPVKVAMKLLAEAQKVLKKAK